MYSIQVFQTEKLWRHKMKYVAKSYRTDNNSDGGSAYVELQLDFTPSNYSISS